MSPRRLAIDFAAARRPPSASGALLLATGALLAAWSTLEFIARDEALATAELQRASLERRIGGRPQSARSADPEIRRLMAGAARVADEIATPWEPLFGDIEASLDETVALLALEPNPGKRQLQLVAEAKTLADALAFVARLNATASLANARIAQQEARVSEGIAALGFRVQADWREARQ